MAVSPSSFLLDTSAYSAFQKGDPRLRAWFSSQYNINVPLIVIAELQAGFTAGSKTKENQELLNRFLDSSPVEIIFPTLETTKKFAELFLQLRTSGIALGTNDLWIAALALEHNLPILTLDADFQRVKGIKIISLTP